MNKTCQFSGGRLVGGTIFPSILRDKYFLIHVWTLRYHLETEHGIRLRRSRSQ